MKRFNFYLFFIPLFLLMIISCPDHFGELHSVNISTAENVSEYAVGQTIAFNITGELDSSVYDYAVIMLELKMKNGDELIGNIEIKDLKSTATLDKDGYDWIILENEKLERFNESFSFNVIESGKYKLSIEMRAYGKGFNHKISAFYNKEIEFSVG